MEAEALQQQSPTVDTGQTRRRSHAVILLLIAVLALGAFLRFHRIGVQSFWDDEVSTALVTQYPVKVIWKEISLIDSNPPMFYTVFRPWYLRLPHTEAWLRAFPALLGVLAVFVFFLLVRRLANDRVAVLASLLMAANPFQIYCSQDLRYNTLLLLSCLLSLYFFVRIMQEARARHAAGYAVSTAVALYTHYFSFFLILVQVAYAVVALVVSLRSLKRDSSSLKRLSYWAFAARSPSIRLQTLTALSLYYKEYRTFVVGLAWFLFGLGAAVVSFMPFIKIFAVQLLKGVPFRSHTPIVTALKSFLVYGTVGHTVNRYPSLSGILDRLSPGGGTSADSLLILLLVPFLLLAVSGFFGWRRERTRGLLVSLYVLVPFVAVMGFIQVVYAFEPRYFLPFFPAFYLVVAKGLDNLSRRVWVVAVLALVYISFLIGASLTDYYYNPAFWRQDWKGTVDKILRNSQENDCVLFYDHYASLPFLNYFDYDLPIYYLLVWREDMKVGDDARRFRMARKLEQISRKYDRVWFVEYHPFVFDPYDHTHFYLKEYGFHQVSRECFLSGLREFCVELHTSDAREARGAWVQEIRFREGLYVEDQLLDGWYPGRKGWRWMKERASVLLPLRVFPASASATFFANMDYLGPEPARTVLSVNGRFVAERTLSISEMVTLEGEVPPQAQGSDTIRVTLSCDRTFTPADVMGGEDTSPRSLLVDRIGIVSR